MITGNKTTHIFGDEFSTKRHKELDNLIQKLQRSEKRLLKEVGKHPVKDRTGNLVHYARLFSDEEIEQILKVVNKSRSHPVHAGSFPFLNREYVLKLLTSAKNDSWLGGFNFTKSSNEQMQSLKKRLMEAAKEASKASATFQQSVGRMYRRRP